MSKRICQAPQANMEYDMINKHSNDRSDHEHDRTGDKSGHNVLKDE